MMSSNSSNNVTKTPGKREIRAAKKAAKKEQKNIKHSQFNFSQLDNTLENSESVDGDNASRTEKPGDYLASGKIFLPPLILLKSLVSFSPNCQ